MVALNVDFVLYKTLQLLNGNNKLKGLTKIELETIRLLAGGMTVDEIALRRGGISLNAVYQTIRGCKDKIGVNKKMYIGNTEQLCVEADRMGLLNESE
jgi:DNA-binding CsgD family transcriptional regulator